MLYDHIMSPFVRSLAALALLTVHLPLAAQASTLTARLEVLAGQGDGEALYSLGMIHHMGLEGATRDPRLAFDYFRRSAEAGDPLGEYKLGCYYAGQGEGIVADDAELALRHKLVAAEAGYALAQIDVARLYVGRGDGRSAVQWFEAAARQGEWGALFMALIHASPDAPAPDRPRAWLYYRVIERTIAEIPEEVPEGEVEMLREALAEMRGNLEEGLSDPDRATGDRMFAAWQVERSTVTLRADQGLRAAYRLAGLEAPTG